MARKRKLTDTVLLQAKELIESGLSLKDVAARFSVSPDPLSKAVRGIGGVVGHRYPPIGSGNGRKNLPSEEIGRLYLGGMSELALSIKFGVNRWAITRRLSEQGIPRRDGSAANSISMAKMSKERRQERVAAARKQAFSNMKTDASLGISNWRVGYGEHEIGNALEAAGHTVDRQRMLDRYCVDLVVGDTAIEVKQITDGTFSSRVKRAVEIADAGLHLVTIVFDRPTWITDKLHEVVTALEFACRNPTARGKYWVIRCAIKECVTEGNSAEITFKERTIKGF